MAENPLLILGDMHLEASGRTGGSRALARLLRRHPGCDLVLAGDTFALSAFPPHAVPTAALGAILAAHPDFRQALAEHLLAGRRATLLAGNHDAALALAPMRESLCALLGVSLEARLEIESWFVRRGAIHAEHGHLYDPDNAPNHPLAASGPTTEPLGVALTRRFIAPQRALRFAHAHETTPLRGLMRAMAGYGVRGPSVILGYYQVAWQLWREAGGQVGIPGERHQGQSELLELAQRTGMGVATLEAMLARAPRPTHLDRAAVFHRLYLDRTVATLLAAGGLVASLTPIRIWGLSCFVLGGTYLVASTARSGSRYRGLLERRLREAAARIVELSAADHVIFSHSHRVDRGERYSNPGSFGYPGPEGHGYVHVETGRVPEIRFVSPDGSGS